MRQLDTCDFCGGAADGVYEVVPAAIAGDPKRLALCADCRTTLQSVVDPLLDDAGEPTQTRTSGADQQQSSTTAGDATASADGTAAAADSDDAYDTADSTDAAAAVDGTNASDAGTAEDDAGTAASDAGTARDDAIDAGRESEGDDAGNSEATDAADADGVTIEPGEGAVDEQPEAASRKPRPDGYAKVVRLLQNRDGAMPREDLRALATNAYDLGSREFEAAVEATIENGDVEESADGLRTV